MVSLWDLRIGDMLELASGVFASVEMPTEDGEWILVRYVHGGSRLELVGQTDIAAAFEVTAVLSNTRS